MYSVRKQIHYYQEYGNKNISVVAQRKEKCCLLTSEAGKADVLNAFSVLAFTKRSGCR